MCVRQAATGLNTLNTMTCTVTINHDTTVAVKPQRRGSFSGQTPRCHNVSFWAFATFLLKELEIKGREDK